MGIALELCRRVTDTEKVLQCLVQSIAHVDEGGHGLTLRHKICPAFA